MSHTIVQIPAQGIESGAAVALAVYNWLGSCVARFDMDGPIPESHAFDFDKQQLGLYTVVLRSGSRTLTGTFINLR